MAEPRRYDFRVEPNDCLPVSINVTSPAVLAGYGAEFAYVAGSLSVLMTAPTSGVSVASLSGNVSLTLPGSLTALIQGGNDASYKFTLVEPSGCRRTVLHGYVVDATK